MSLVGFLAALFLVAVATAGYGYYTELRITQARVTQLEQNIKEQKETIGTLAQSLKSRKRQSIH
jgi:cell division protein FtsL